MADGMTTDMTGGLYRRIYAGFITGKRINAVTWEAEAWFWRLHAIADDFGNLPGDPIIMRAYAAPRRDLTIEAVVAMTLELTKQHLIAEYQHAGDSYVHIDGFEKRQPAGKNGKRIQKYPVYPGCIQVNPGESRIIQVCPGHPAPPIPIPIPIPITKTKTKKDLPAAPGREKPARSERTEEVLRLRRRIVERDALWDAVVSEWGLPVATKTQQGRVGAIVCEFQGAGATPAEIPIRHKAIAAAWGPEKATPESVAKHWGEFVPRQTAEDKRRLVREAETKRHLAEVHESDAKVLAERAKRTQK
jgi:hypothetical protein